MRRAIGIALGVTAGCLLLLAVAATVFMKAVFGGMCGNQVLSTVPSPDGRFQAVVFDRDCGATTGFSTQVSVLPAGKGLPNESGNVFVADSTRGAAPSGPGGGPRVTAVWQDSHHLVIHHAPRARVFVSKKSIRVRLGFLRWQTVSIRAASP